MFGESIPLVLLDTSCYQQLQQQQLQLTNNNDKHINKGKKEREDIIGNTIIPPILDTLRKKGNVIIPVDCNSRLLELLYGLNKYWHENAGNTDGYDELFVC